MRPATPWRTWLHRVLSLGPSRLALALAVLLVFVSLAFPFWSLSRSVGTDQAVSSFSWTTVTTDQYRAGVWDGTTILPYTSTQATDRAVAAVLGAAYLLDVVLLVVLVVVLGLFSSVYSRTMSTLSHLFVSLVVLGVALFALFYPIVAIPGAATTDVGTFTIGGFWGSVSVATPRADWAWGPGLGWWLLLAGVVPGVLGAVLPYLKSIRSTTPPPPPGWRPPS